MPWTSPALMPQTRAVGCRAPARRAGWFRVGDAMTAAVPCRGSRDRVPSASRRALFLERGRLPQRANQHGWTTGACPRLVVPSSLGRAFDVGLSQVPKPMRIAMTMHPAARPTARIRALVARASSLARTHPRTPTARPMSGLTIRSLSCHVVPSSVRCAAPRSGVAAAISTNHMIRPIGIESATPQASRTTWRLTERGCAVATPRADCGAGSSPGSVGERCEVPGPSTSTVCE